VIRGSIRTLGTLVGIALLAAPAALAQTSPPSSTESPSAAIPDRAGVVYADKTRLTATVEAVDREKRTFTLKGPQGKTVTLKAPPEMRNFDQLEAGDTVRADYVEAIALVLRRPGAAPEATAARRLVSVAPKGEKPGAAMVETVELQATIEAIDLAARTVTLRGPGGGSRTITVDPSVEKFDEVKVGDEVVVRHTEALAIAVDR
jgi:hypothetical protein